MTQIKEVSESYEAVISNLMVDLGDFLLLAGLVKLLDDEKYTQVENRIMKIHSSCLLRNNDIYKKDLTFVKYVKQIFDDNGLPEKRSFFDNFNIFYLNKRFCHKSLEVTLNLSLGENYI